MRELCPLASGAKFPFFGLLFARPENGFSGPRFCIFGLFLRSRLNLVTFFGPPKIFFGLEFGPLKRDWRRQFWAIQARRYIRGNKNDWSALGMCHLVLSSIAGENSLISWFGLPYNLPCNNLQIEHASQAPHCIQQVGLQRLDDKMFAPKKANPSTTDPTPQKFPSDDWGVVCLPGSARRSGRVMTL